MKVLMLGWELPPHNSGGLGVACYQLCKALSKQKIDIEFILPYQADHQVGFMNITAARPQDVSTVALSLQAYDSFKYVSSNGNSGGIHEQQYLYEQGVMQIVEQREFDIIHAHDWLTFRAALRAKEVKKCPIVLHVHSVESDRAGGQPGNPFVREIESLCLQLADRIVAVSNHTKKAIIREYHIPADKIEVVHNSIGVSLSLDSDDINAYKYLAAMKNQGYKIVTNVGRLTIQKGLPNLLKAAQRVIEKEPKTLFLLVGSGEQHHELVELSANLGIGKNVLFADFQRGKKWRDAFKIADLFVMPSVSEPFGLTPLEAAGYGTPALISKQSGVSEVFYNCLKVDHWDIHEMANKIIAAITSPALSRELSNNALREYGNMSWDEAGRKIKNIYQEQMEAAGTAA